MMAEIGKRTAVATLFGIRLHGFVAWWIWRTYYLSNLPTIKKKLKVMGDWTMDLIYTPDVAMIKKQLLFAEEKQLGQAEGDRPDHNVKEQDHKVQAAAEKKEAEKKQ